MFYQLGKLQDLFWFRDPGRGYHFFNQTIFAVFSLRNLRFAIILDFQPTMAPFHNSRCSYSLQHYYQTIQRHNMTQHHMTRHHTTRHTTQHDTIRHKKIFYIQDETKSHAHKDETKSHTHRMKQNLDLGWEKSFCVLWCCVVSCPLIRHMCRVVSIDTTQHMCRVVSY